MKKVLILGVSAVQLDAILLLKEMGCEVHACAMTKDGPGADAADYFTQINIIDEPLLEKYILDKNISAIYSTGSDIAMPVACRLSEKLRLPAFVSSRTAYICNHKNAMRQALGKECGGNIPYQVLERCEPVALSFPCVMKPSDSQGQRGVFLVHSQNEVNQNFNTALQYSREHKVIIEHYIDGPEFSVNGYFVDGNLRFMAVSDRETWPEYIGLIHRHVVPTQILDEKQTGAIYDLILDACRRVELRNGPAYFQIKMEAGNPFIVEMTPRLDGCHMWNVLSRSTGVHLMALSFAHLLYGDITELKRQFETQIPYELTFFCQEPRTVFNARTFAIPPDSVLSFFYYGSSDIIRPVNGRYEKVGYYIRELKK